VEPVLERFQTYMDAEGLSEKTKKNYLMVARSFLSQLKTPVSRATVEDVLSYISRFKESKATQKVYAYGLRHFFKAVGGLDYRLIPIPKGVREPEVKALEEEDVKKIVSNIDLLGLPASRAVKYKAIIALTYELALRVSEAAGLKRKDLDEKSWECYVVRCKSLVPRVLPITTDWVKDCLGLYLPKAPKEGEAPLFPNRSGGFFRVEALSMLIHRLMSAAGYPYKPHVLRHTRATVLLKRGVDFFVVSRFLGHVNPANTAIYLHLTSEDIKRGLLKVEGR